jgi:UDP-N-acetylglucosamine diphosphorylase / glucose-1-phosphate thymidylyltransferase / UDP-N-acetylgalactosamine diphosphorylase / glucosamine-1-phosphate N-acetyltransferase / galactosamine-1-phosphate N-acetyltransferase
MLITLVHTDKNPLLEPFSLTRPVCDLRIGILTLREKWMQVPALSIKNSFDEPTATGCFPAGHIPSAQWLLHAKQNAGWPGTDEEARTLTHALQLVQWNDWAIREDYLLLTHGRSSQPIPVGVQANGVHQIFIEEGARIAPCMINAATGPVYIGKNAEILEGALIRGPVSVGAGALVKMGTKIYGATTIGPYCLAGGEIKNSILMGYSNKAHDGYLGDSVLGEWCNLGAGTSNSNIKNTAGPVTIQLGGLDAEAGNKCGLLMGDYSRSAINTSFNTGTVTGVCCNVFGAGLTPRNIPHFSWGWEGEKYRFDKAITDINNWMQLKGHCLTEDQIEQLKTLYQQP